MSNKLPPLLPAPIDTAPSSAPVTRSAKRALRAAVTAPRGIAPATEAPAPVAPPVETPAPLPAAPVEAPVAQGWQILRSALAQASTGRNWTRPASSYDALADFASRLGAPFPSGTSTRDNILRLTSLATGKGRATGAGARWSAGYSLALTDYIKGAPSDEAAKDRRDEVKSIRAVASVWKALGGISFTSRAEQDDE